MTPGGASVRPAYGHESLADVMPGVLRSLGVDGSSDPLGLSIGPLAGVRSVAVLLLDGFGYDTLPLALPHAPTLRALLSGSIAGTSARPITTGFPSTTPTSLTSLGTGAAPGAHGLLGFFLNVPGTNRVLNHLHWRDDPDPLRWQPMATQFDVAEAAGVRARVVSKPDYRGSGLSRAAFRGGGYVNASTLNSVREGILEELAKGRAVVYGYHPEIDSEGHLFGVGSPEWIDAVADVDRMLTRLVDKLPRNTALIITADHGQINVPWQRRFDLDVDRRLRAGVRVVAGEARVRYLHTVPGATDDVIAAWRGVLGDAAWVVSRDQAVAEGWFGPVPEQHLQRIGDVVAACNEDYVVLATATDPPGVARMIAFHGSATEPEMRIPLVIYRRS